MSFGQRADASRRPHSRPPNVSRLAFRGQARIAVYATFVTLVASGSASAAAPDVPFRDGASSARQIATVLNRDSDYSEVVCLYRSPVVKCNGFQRMKRSDAYTGFVFTFHKTAARSGFVVRCYPRLLGCLRERMTYAR